MAIDTSDSHKHIADFLAVHQVGVLATANRAAVPHAATIYLTTDSQLNIYFVTKKETQKCRNLQENPNAAIAIYDGPTQTTVQAQGSVIEITDSDRQDWVFKDVWQAAVVTSPAGSPPPTQLIAGGYCVFKLETPLLRMATFTHLNNTASPDIFEITHTQPSL